MAVNSHNANDGVEVANTLTVEKTSSGTSWGAVYAQFFQPVTEIKASNAGLTIKRELFVEKATTIQKMSFRQRLATNL